MVAAAKEDGANMARKARRSNSKRRKNKKTKVEEITID